MPLPQPALSFRLPACLSVSLLCHMRTGACVAPPKLRSGAAGSNQRMAQRGGRTLLGLGKGAKARNRRKRPSAFVLGLGGRHRGIVELSGELDV